MCAPPWCALQHFSQPSGAASYTLALMSESFFIRPANAADLPAILRIQDACYSSITPEDPQAYLHKLALAPDCAFVMDSAATGVQAYVFALPIALSEPPSLNAHGFACNHAADCLYLHDMAIDPAARGQGLSAPLMGAFFAAAAKRQLPWCSLIAIQNSSAFWARWGFAAAAISRSAAIQSKLSSYGQAQYLLRRSPETGAESA